MKHWKAWAVLLLVLAGLPAGAYAQWAYTAKDVNLRAGPARDFPLVARLPRGLSVSVAGCLSDFRWCDVVAGPNRGWVYAGNLVSSDRRRQPGPHDSRRQAGAPDAALKTARGSA
jgi:uncharacterized protein YraI